MKSLNGIFVSANEEQLAKIWEACAANGFPLDQGGILSLLMMLIDDMNEEEVEGDEPEAPDALSGILNHFTQNPAQAEALKDAGAKLFNRLFTKPK